MGIQDTVTDNVPRTEHSGSTTAIDRRLDVDGTGCETAVDGDDGRGGEAARDLRGEPKGDRARAERTRRVGDWGGRVR